MLLGFTISSLQRLSLVASDTEPIIKTVTLFKPPNYYAVTPESNQVKVVILTYSRSGSSFMGELFNRNSNGFYYFEPLCGLYAHLYGMQWGMHSPAYFNYAGSSLGLRHSPEYEAQYLAHAMNDLLSCQFERTPVDALQGYFTMHMNIETGFSKYKECLRNEAKARKIKVKQKYGSAPVACKEYIRSTCRGTFDNKTEFNCFRSLFGTEFPNKTPISNATIMDKLPHIGDAFQYPKLTRLSGNDQFSKHDSCINKTKQYSNTCLPHLTKRCSNSSVIGAKLIRLRMENIAFLLALDPKIKVVHYIRDPRGVMNSRAKGNINKMSKAGVADTKETCGRIMKDILVRRQLEAKYPENFMQIKYEDLALNPIGMAKTLYEFLGMDLPKDVANWLLINTSKKGVRKRAMNTSRSNSTSTALKWMSIIKPSVRQEINKYCYDVIKELNYPL